MFLSVYSPSPLLPAYRGLPSALVWAGSSLAAACWAAAFCACVPRCGAASTAEPASDMATEPSRSWLGWALDTTSDRYLACVGEVVQRTSGVDLVPCECAAPSRGTCKQQQSMSDYGRGLSI